MAEEIFKHSPFNLESLLTLSTAIRGRKSTCNVSTPPMTGLLNWAICVCFDDDVEWIFRSPRLINHAILSERTALKMLSSEAATLKYLRAHTTIPVPEVYSYCASHENEIGVPYILMSKATGCALSEFDWNHAHTSPQNVGASSLRPISDDAREKVARQLGVITSKLLGLRLEKIGSLFEDDDGNYQVGECLSPMLLWQWRDSLEGINRGPFDNDSEYLHSIISAFTLHARELPMAPNSLFGPIPDTFEYPACTNFGEAASCWNIFIAMGQKTDHSKNRLCYCIAGQLLHEIVPYLSTQTKAGFPLIHPDLHLDNIFVDENFNISCLIDWGSASSASIPQLLSMPRLGSSIIPSTASLVTAFKTGFNTEFRGADEVWWEKALIMWPFLRLMKMRSEQDYDLFQMLYTLVRKLEGTGSVDIPQLFHQQAAREDNKRLLAELSKNGSRKDYVEREEVVG